MAINNTQKAVIAKKVELRDKIIAALRASEDFAEVDYFEKVGDCDIAGQREPEDVMCDLLDAYAAKEEGRRCREALHAKEEKKVKNGK